MQKGKDEKRKKRGEEIVLLQDLAPRKEVKGGAGKIVFGERAETSEDEPLASQRKQEKKSQQPK